MLRVDALPAVIIEIYRPSEPGHWRARIGRRLRRWLDRPDARLRWTATAEATDDGWRHPLPGRAHAPRCILFDDEPSPGARALLAVLAPHVATAVTTMERATSPEGAYPPRWRTLLTARQIEVAVLVAGGLSNDEVATRLGLATRTVARLLGKVFAALGVQNRATLAAEYVTGRPPTPD